MAARCTTTLSFWPQLVKVRRQGAQDLSLAMLCMYLTGAILWLIYGILNAAIAVIAANIVALGLVSAIAVMKIRSDAALAAPAVRRLRIAIDMDEVMADALAEHLRRYNAAFGTALTHGAAARRASRALPSPPAHRAAAEAMIDEDLLRRSGGDARVPRGRRASSPRVTTSSS